MSTPTTAAEFLELVRRSGLIDEARLPGSDCAPDPAALADQMVRSGLITRFQAQQLLRGRWRRFLLAGKYKILELLGVGGMGSVYLAEHVYLNRLVALKVLPAGRLDDDPAAVARFYREGRAVAALKHRNIVQVYDVEPSDGQPFLVLEFIDGTNLHALVTRHGPLEPRRAAHYIAQAAAGLQHAHDAGLFHCDVKPGNLLLDRSGTVKILDLGLARFFRDREATGDDDGIVLGTVDFIAPEQVTRGPVDGRADVYSLGATFYYLLTGKVPCGDGSPADKLHVLRSGSPVPVRERRPEVPAAMAAVVATMTAKSPADRFGKPGAVAGALAAWAPGPLPRPPGGERPRYSPAVKIEAPVDIEAPPETGGPPTDALAVGETDPESRPIRPEPPPRRPRR